MEKYENLGTVGEGSYGLVLKCKDRTNGSIVAIKKFLESDNDKSVKKIAIREIRILKSLRHENLINLIEVFRRNKRIYLVFEYIENNLLEEIEKTKNGLGEERTKEVMYQVVRGIDFMHSNNVIHRDIKPENVLINVNGLVKLCDFGFARQIAQPSEIYTDYVATRWYRSPELLVGDPKYGKPVDIWSVGVLAYEVLTSKPLYPGESDLDQLFLIVNSLGDITESMKACFQKNQFYSNSKMPKIKNFTPLQNKLKKYSPNLVKFILDSLIIDPHKRYTSAELLQHEYFIANSWVDEFLVKLKKLVSLHQEGFSRATTVQSTASTMQNEHSSKPKPIFSNTSIKPTETSPEIKEKSQIDSNKTLIVNSNSSSKILMQQKANSVNKLNLTQTNANNIVSVKSNSINNFFNPPDQNNQEKSQHQAIAKPQQQQQTEINANHVNTNQNTTKNSITIANFNSESKTSFTSTIVNDSIKKINPKKQNTIKETLKSDSKSSKYFPLIERQATETPKIELQSISKTKTVIQTTNPINGNSFYNPLTTGLFNAYKQQNPFNTINNMNNGRTTYSNLNSRNHSNSIDFSLMKGSDNNVTNSSLSMVNDLSTSTNVNRSNSNNVGSSNVKNANNKTKSNFYVIDEHFKINNKNNQASNLTHDSTNSNSSSNKQDTKLNNELSSNSNVRLPQVKSIESML